MKHTFIVRLTKEAGYRDIDADDYQIAPSGALIFYDHPKFSGATAADTVVGVLAPGTWFEFYKQEKEKV